MSLTALIAKNTFWQIVGKIIGTALGVMTVGLLTRYLGQEGFGYYTTALAFMQFFGVLVDMGLYLICLKEISAKPKQEQYILSNFFSLRVVSAAIFLGGGALLIFAFPYPPIVKWSAVIVSLSFFFMALVQILTSVFQKNLTMGKVALAEVIGRLGFLSVIVLFIFYQGNLPVLMFGNVANTFIYFLLLWFLIKKYVRLNWQVDWHYWQEILKKSWPIALGIAFNLVYFRADTIILSLYRPAADVGLYGAPYKILEIITTFPHMFMGLLMPILTVAWIAQDKERFQNTLQRGFDFFALLVVPLVLGSIPLAERIMRVLAGRDFTAAGALLPILMLATGFIFIGTLFTYTLVVLDKQKPMLKFYFLAAVLSLIGYFVFIPRYSYFGAAWVTVFSELFIVVCAWALSYSLIKIKLGFKNLGKIITAGLLMLGLIYLIIDWPIYLIIPVAGLFFGALILAFKVIDKKLLNDIFNSK